MELGDIFSYEGPLATCFPGFEKRDGQEAMAEAIVLALACGGQDADASETPGSNVVVIEAETGIGKTLAYLIPAVLSGKKVVISTATLNLQDQIIEKDIPLVEKIMEESVAAVCVKGRENYLCLYRWYQYRSNPQLSLIENPNIEKIDTWLKRTRVGDRAELGWLGEKSSFWSKISARSSQCLGSDCPEGSGCFVTKLRKRAGAAQLLIVNHHLFFSDLALRKNGYGELLPRYEAVVFDEAHHIENVASTFFGKSFSQYQLLDLLSDIEQQCKLDLPPESIDKLLSILSGVKRRIDSFTDIFPSKIGRFHLQSFIKEFSDEAWQDSVWLLLKSIVRLADTLSDYGKYGENWNVYIKRAEELEASLKDLALGSGEGEEDYVRWFERRERAILISATPIEVAPSLIENLYSNVDTCILTSATLSSAGSFSYLQRRLGLGDSTSFLKFNSPFDYKKRSLFYIPESEFPEPADENYPIHLGERILEILYMSQGRALVLCTSFRGMNDIAEVLQEKLDYTVLVQGRESRNSLLAKFREETHSVLVAVASFWEGVDVVGDSLSCVVIDKLPFEVPSDPVLNARIERIKADGGNPFFTFQVPRAVLTLRQGVGRLMRSASDCGVVAIMDVRLFKKGYGKTFLKSLPSSRVSRELDEIDYFFRSMDKQVGQEMGS